MVSTANTNLPHIPGYDLIEQIYTGSKTAVYRAIQDHQQHPVVIKVLQREYPSFSELVQFRNQYTIAKNLKIPGIVRPLSIEPWRNSFALVMEDSGGVSLKQYTQNQPLDWLEVLVISLQLAEILHHLIQHRVVHKDIKPANILIHPNTGTVQLIDFSISSLLSKEIQELKNPNVLEGTLAYLAPEQTGRMNRGIDYRTDFYSLGVTLYELLTGQLPFDGEDPLELVHCHIAKQPISPREINQNIPEVVSKIVLKLMAKNAEDRYQSALGLKYDLEKCVNQGKETGTVVEFELAQRDVSDRFIIPEKLYGREAEVAQLLAAFGGVATQDNNSELILVAGFSGIGKTAVVNEVHKPIVRQKGYFIKGKFDQFNRNIPFSALVQALRDLMGQLLSESEGQLQQWKEKILDAVGENGQVIIEVIPELEKIIGKQAPVAELSGSAAQNRFNLLFNKFIQVFTTKEHPLVIFLDDLQWADSASLNLIKLLISEGARGYLLLIGAYRDNEVFPAHPLMLTIDDIAKSSEKINTITLSPLSEKNISNLVADTLSCTAQVAKPLTELVYQKTKGNPFFTTQFLLGLYRDELIKFNFEVGYWECNISEIRQRAITDDVVEFMARRLQKLPVETQEVLQLAACIGNQFDLHTLAIVCEHSQKETADELWIALKEGLILPQNENYKFFQQDNLFSAKTQTEQLIINYKFVHDCIQQAAYFLISEDQKQITHLTIGRLLLNNTSIKNLDHKIFDIVNQINLGSDLITKPSEREQLAKLNFRAGKKAKIATAYTAAFKYAEIARSLLQEKYWEQNYQFTLSVHELAAETAYLNGDFQHTEILTNILLRKAKSDLEKLKTHEVIIQVLISQNQLSKAIQIALIFLSVLGLDLPENPDETDINISLDAIAQKLSFEGIESLASLATMTNRIKLASMRILSVILNAAYLGLPNLLPIIVSKQIDLSITYGNTDASPSAYANYGLILCSFADDIDSGYLLGNVALNLLNEVESQEFHAKTIEIVCLSVKHWKEHINSTLSLLLNAYKLGLESGDFESASFAIYDYCAHSFVVGKNLVDLQQEMSNFSAIIKGLKQRMVFHLNELHRQVVLNLTGENECLFLLKGEAYDEQKMLPIHKQDNDFSSLALFNIDKLFLCYLFGDHHQALEIATEVESYLEGIPGQVFVPWFYFYEALSWLALYPSLGKIEQESVLKRLISHQARLEKWADNAAMNYAHKLDLIQAETCRVKGQNLEAIELYDKAIAGAQENEYIQEEALANELAAKFYLNWSKEKVAAGYMQEAYYCYARWGAKAKTDDLEKRYPNLLKPILEQTAPSFNPLETFSTVAQSTFSIQTSTAATQSSLISINSALDFATVLKASQALSGIMELEELLRHLTQIILQNSGGDHCALILPNSEGEWSVEAIATLEETELCSQPLENNPHLPNQLIQYVKNTQEVLVIDDLETDLPVIDEYLLEKKPQSTLCLPIINQGHLIGILYLQNSTTRDAFTPERILVLNFICTQAAISLENAHLYQKSQAYAQQLEESLQKLQITQKQLRQDEQMMQQQALGLIQLSQSQAITQGFLLDSYREITEVVAKLLQVERVSIWLFDQTTTKLECFDLFQASSQEHSNGIELQESSFPSYFAAIKSQHILSIHDAWNDPRSSEFSHGYLDVFNIKSMLESSFSLNGKICGVVCCETTGEKRVWKQAEQNFLRSVANLIALAIESSQRQNQAQQLKLALSDLEASQLQMVQHEKMASLGNLVAGVAHEINNPLGFLNGSIGNAKDYLKDIIEHLELYQEYHPDAAEPVQENAEEIDLEFLCEDIPKMLDSMEIATQRIKNISTSLRTFSRADTEHKVSADLHEGLDSTLLILKYRLKANDVRPAIEVIKDYGALPPIECFPGQLNQVFMNIIANAIDVFDEASQDLSYSELESKSQKITIQTLLITEQNAVKIIIGDNGKGMKKEVKQKIFDHLFTTKGVGKGTGLGLAIAQQIVVDKHGGSLEVKSDLGKGTQFWIRLPISGHV